MNPSSWRVTISILGFASADTIEAAIRSALDQTHPGPIDVVVREQGGDDAEWAVVEGLASAWRSRPGAAVRTLAVERGANLGVSGGHNRAIDGTSGEIVIVLNSDARLAPDFLERALPAFLDPTVGAVQAKVLREDGVVDCAGIIVERNRRARGRGQGEPDDGSYDEPGEVFGTDTAIGTFRRAALDDVAVPTTSGREVFPEAFIAYWDEVDLAWRLRSRGWRTRYVPAAVAWHERSARERESDPLLAGVAARRAMPFAGRIFGWGNDRMVRVRVEPLRHLLRDAPWVLARDLASVVLLLTRPRDVGPTLRHLVANVGPALRARRHTVGRWRPDVDVRPWFGTPWRPW